MDDYFIIVDKFVKQLEYDKEYGKSRAFSSYAWRVILNTTDVTQPFVLQFSRQDLDDKEYQEFFDFIDGNGYEVLTERNPIIGIITFAVKPILRVNYDIE